MQFSNTKFVSIISIALVCLAFIGHFFLFQSSNLLISLFSLLAPLLIAGFIWLYCHPQGKRLKDYFFSSWLESKKVVWPSIRETWQMGLIVCLFVLLLTLIVWMTDGFAYWLFYKVLLGRG